VYAAWSLHDRCKSSSGGAFSAVARYVLDKNGIVFGACFDGKFNVVHTHCKDAAELNPVRGSKYAQSNVGDAFRQVKKYIDGGTSVLFSGTPCQIDGLNSFLGIKAGSESLLTVEIVCHGVPSGKIFRSYIEKLCKENKYANNVPDNFFFRKLDGWGFSPAIQFAERNFFLFGNNNVYMTAFNKNAIFRKSCYSCPYATQQRNADFTLADFWGIGRYGLPFRHSTMRGVSLVLANSIKAEKLMTDLRPYLFFEERTLEEALIENHQLREPSRLTFSRREELCRDFMNPDISLKRIAKKYKLNENLFRSLVMRFLLWSNTFNPVREVYNRYKQL
jgi:hypothetical protein